MLCLTHPHTPCSGTDRFPLSALNTWATTTKHSLSPNSADGLACDKPGLALLSSSGSLVAGAPFLGFGVQAGPVWGKTAALSVLIQELPSQGPAPPAQAGQDKATYSCNV